LNFMVVRTRLEKSSSRAGDFTRSDGLSP